MKLYFKHEAESDLGMGIAYIEFDGDWASRQVEIYGDKWFLSNTVYHPETRGMALCDQPLSETCLGTEHEISESEFELVWSEALKKSMLNN
ncbi:MAG: hypothetical protein V7L31_17840 [Nostoc sp.]|uniref:hypothetical protein n=1 Tax=Nostoc sp. TaxID=1180 RepID=UPI002FF30B52